MDIGLLDPEVEVNDSIADVDISIEVYNNGNSISDKR